jgi:hypothetical protein
MISASPRLAMLAVVLSVLVIAGILYGLFGDSVGMKNVYRAPVGSAAGK